jgi:drug/metabolite transporter (DMT)-like permease
MPGSRSGYRLDLLPASAAYAATLVCFVFATKLTTAASAIFLQSTAPIWVVLLAPWLIGESIRARDLPFVGAAGAGLVLVFLGSRGSVATAPHPTVGNLSALASGLFYALLLILFRRLARQASDDRTLAAAVLGNALAFLLCAPFAFPVTQISAHDVTSILYLGVIQIGVAYWLFARALRQLPALEVALLILLEPVLNPLWTWLLLGERPSALAALGGAVMVVALAGKAVLDRVPRSAEPPPSGSPA